MDTVDGAAATRWDAAYQGTPHWDLGHPQPAFQALADAGALTGRVLDAGCGTGEHVLMAAARGLDATGIDISPTALAAAEAKARHRNLPARFLLRDARHLTGLGRFDTILDSGLLHALPLPDRAPYLASIRTALHPTGRFLALCLRTTPTAARTPRPPTDQSPVGAPHRLSRADLEAAFATAWHLTLEAVPLDSPAGPGIPGWLVTATPA